MRERYFLLDSWIIAETRGVDIVLGEVAKHEGNPLLVMDKPWEVTVNNLYPNVLYDEQRHLYRCWYLIYGSGRYDGLCYAESKDGIVWEKPNLGLVPFDGSKENNLIRFTGAHGVGVFLDRHDPVPSRRYKMFYNAILSGGEHGPMATSFSADGIHWTPPVTCPRVGVRGDTHNNALWSPTLNRYVGITRAVRTKDGKAIRQVAWTCSNDFSEWTEGKVILEGLQDHLQVYSMPVFYHGGIYLGLPAILDTETRRVQTELAWSPDTLTWHRVHPGTALIPNAANKDGYDWGMIFAAAYPVFEEKSIRLYYAGGRLPHRGKYDAGLCLATLRPDGFAGYRATEKGVITTKAIPCAGISLNITADAEGGQVLVSLLDESGNPVMRSRPISSDVTDSPVKWPEESTLAQHIGGTIRLRFELNNATLYSFSFAP